MRLAVIGGGAGGLLLGILAARAGHDVTIVDRDELAQHGASASVEPTLRPGAPHVVQGHVGTPLLRRLLRRHLPDLYDELLRRGVGELGVTDRMPEGLDSSPRPGDDDLAVLMLSRVAFDAALHAVARRQSGLAMQPARRVTGLVASGVDPVTVRGVRVGGETVTADVVVDASGRRSRIDAWLAEVGAASTRVEFGECGRSYYTRHYRLRAGERPPAPRSGLLAATGSFIAMGFPAEQQSVQIGFATLAADVPLRALHRPKPFEALAWRIPGFVPWLQACEPISEVFAMGGLHNTFRRLVIEGRPVVRGLIAVGDSVCTTNPTFGRGLALTLTQAVDAVDALGAHGRDLDALARAVDAASVAHVRPWFARQAEFDAWDLANRRAAVLGAPAPPPLAAPPGQVTQMQLQQAGRADPELFRLGIRVGSGLVDPDDVLGDPEVVRAVRAVLDGVDPAPPEVALDRDALLELLTV